MHPHDYRSLQLCQFFVHVKSVYRVLRFQSTDQNALLNRSSEKGKLNEGLVGENTVRLILVFNCYKQRQISPTNRLDLFLSAQLWIVSFYFEEDTKLVLSWKPDVVHLLVELYRIPFGVKLLVLEHMNVWAHCWFSLKKPTRGYHWCHYKMNFAFLLRFKLMQSWHRKSETKSRLVWVFIFSVQLRFE